MSKKNTKNVLIKYVAPVKLKADLEQLARVRNISLSALLRLISTNYVKEKG